MKKYLFGFTMLALFSCTISFPDLKKADDYSKKIIMNIQQNDWDSIWENSSRTYRQKISNERFLGLKKWVNSELGKIKKFKRTYFYTGSSFTMQGENYVKIVYEVKFSKGSGIIEIVLVQEDKDFKIHTLEFTKKPVY
jgi:hypothetical protein